MERVSRPARGVRCGVRPPVLYLADVCSCHNTGAWSPVTRRSIVSDPGHAALATPTMCPAPWTDSPEPCQVRLQRPWCSGLWWRPSYCTGGAGGGLHGGPAAAPRVPPARGRAPLPHLQTPRPQLLRPVMSRLCRHPQVQGDQVGAAHICTMGKKGGLWRQTQK